MHLELPKGRLHSLKDFSKHYLMIVLSILTALGLEAWIERSHHTHAAEVASQQIEAEIRTNLTETHAALEHDAEQLKRLSKIRDSLIEDFKARVPEDTIKRHILEQAKDRFDLGLRFPSLRHEAWDVGVANQAVSWIDHERVQRYSAAYANQRDSAAAMTENISILMTGTGLVDTVADLQTDEAQPREFLHVISQMIAMQRQMVNNLGLLEKQLAAALPNGSPDTAKPAQAS
ncbi:hypothetical protein [Dyella subtropica]|uniref:hypothetical protein n=1 Tax=Dyella subtropica TaxID=2992127 RepID=UPI002252F5D5|nr:hypothetical protein [Dyella subtropica]